MDGRMVQSRLVSRDRLIRHHSSSSNDWEIRRIVEALHFLEETMPLLQPSVEDFACILLKCRKGRKLEQALCLHAYMRQCGLEVHASLGNHLLSVLVAVGSMCHAQQVFDRLVYRDECSWSSLISGYVKCGESCHALTLYQKMQEHDSLHPSGYTVVALLKACAALKDLERGRTLHLEIARKGLLERDVFVGSTLVDMYAKCGSLVQAQEVFDKLPVRDVVLWTALIGGYTEHGHGEEALNCVRQMQHEGISPDAFTIVCSLKACGIIGATEKGQEIHAEAVRKGLEMELLVGNSLVDVYARCGSLATAQNLFNKLPVRDVVSWNALITGYVEHGGDDEALYTFEQMECKGISRDAVTLVCSLKACGSIGATIKGQEIHAEIASKGLERALLLGNTLVHMYAKCGLLAEAQKVFDKLSVRDVVSWTALIAGYVEHGCGEEALDCFEQIQHDHISLNVVTFVCCLKACGSIGAIVKGQEIHAEIVRKGLERELLAGNTLVDIYAKCGMLATAQEVFDKLLIRDVVSWNALIAGYVEHGRGEEALLCFEQMQRDGIYLGAVTFFYIVNGCSSLGATVKGQEIHSEIAKNGLEGDLLISNTLVDMYAKCGFLIEARAVFDKLPVRDMVSWTALLTGYTEHGHDEEALNCFKQMQDDGISMNAVTSVCILKACGSIDAIVRSREIHAEIARKGLERELLIGSTLVDMYAKCGLLGEAQEVFDKLPVRDVVLWTALMAGYANHGRGEEALDCFKQMQHDNISMNAVVLICSLKCCASIGATVKGLEIHAEIAKKGLEKELLIGSTLVDMYAKCGLLAEAQEVFDKLAARDMVPWTALMAGYTEHGCGEGALVCFGQMQHDGISLNAVTFVCGLKACGSIKATAKGQEIHAEITKKGLETELLVGNTLVDMYAKSGLLATARKVFDRLPARDVVSWNALIAGYVEHGHGEEALDCFEQMRYEGISLNAITLICSLKACGSLGATIKGRETHAKMVKKGLERELLLGNILIDMYAKCGLLAEAQEVFDKLPVQDVISWNALIAGYVLLGESENVFCIFDRMIVHIKPNLVTFVSVLNACSHAGLVKKGQMCFETITNDYGFSPTLEHYTCMVDLFGRAGQIDKAVAMIRKMPLHPDTVVWHTVLGACRKWGNVELARHAFEHAVRFGEKVAAAYVCMSNIYADADMQEEVDKVGQ